MKFQFTTASILVDAKLYLRQWEICSHVPRPSGYASEVIINNTGSCMIKMCYVIALYKLTFTYLLTCRVKSLCISESDKRHLWMYSS